MLSSILTTSTFLLTLLSFTTASPTPLDAPIENSLETRQSDYQWHISNFDARCANGVCHYELTIEAGPSDDNPGFMATCYADNVPRASREFRRCSINRGGRRGVQSVQAFVELAPRRPWLSTRMVVEVGFNEGGGQVTYWRGRQDGTYQTFRDLSDSGEFDVVPFQYAAVA